MDRYEWIDPITKDKFAVTALDSFFEDTETARGDVYHTHAGARSEILRLASDLKAKDAELEAVNAERVKGFAKLAALGEQLLTKDAELASLKAENADLIARLERAEKALKQAETLMRDVLRYCVCSACVGDDGRDYPHSGDKAIEAGHAWLKERR